ncbi:hypothetical protein SCHPADRAFT_942429 [Schizopora paradoxa]|uniref:MYND-type domain-containing protein n=1 Tax=Schizopora paradoxa TaxID=27342 RepID=A0A0H2RGL0_9AGAM|nr:hypothetical protein SCHPADRAFT_942429 [Schizopora paradoxa]
MFSRPTPNGRVVWRCPRLLVEIFDVLDEETRSTSFVKNDFAGEGFGVMDELKNMMGSLTLDARAVRKSIAAAKNGSTNDLQKLPGMMSMLTPDLVTEATTMFCTHLEPSPLYPEKPLSSSLTQRRPRALNALASIGNIADAVVADPKAAVHSVIRRSWPDILNWMRYFYYEVTTATPKSDLEQTVIVIIASVVMKVARNRPLFVRAVTKDDLLNLIIKDWLQTDDHPKYDAAHRYRVLAYAYEALAILDQKDENLTAQARDMILREADGHPGAMTKRLMQYLKNPAKASKECYQNVLFAVGMAAYLAIEDRTRGTPSAFMDNFLRDDLVQLLTQLLVFLSEDVARPRDLQAFPEDSYSIIIPHSIRILGCCIRSRNGPHWVAVMMKNGFLRAIARIVAFPQHLEICEGGILDVMLDQDIPQYFVHRLVVIAAIKAAKEITQDGSVKNFESSHVKNAWAQFETILLDRTVFNAIYERDLAERDILQCSYCDKDKMEAQLFKCAGCKTVIYCSKECQTASWKTGGHRTNCKVMQNAWYYSGMKQPTDQFSYALALFEIHRHTPGVRKLIASPENPNGIPLSEAFFIVSYAFIPPGIHIKSFDEVLNTPGQRPETRGVMQLIVDTVRKDEGKSLPMQVHCHRGGHIPTITTHSVPANILDFAYGDINPGDETVEYISRRPAKDIRNEPYPFVLTEVDEHVIDARKNYRQPTSGDEASSSSPKTIYHCVEQQVAKNKDSVPDAWKFLMKIIFS